MSRLPLQSEALFDPPPSTPLPRIKPRPSKASGEPVWSKYRPLNPLPCDDCKQAQHEGIMREHSRQAKWRRKDPDGTDRLLCREHAGHWRERDGLNIPRDMRTAGGRHR